MGSLCINMPKFDNESDILCKNLIVEESLEYTYTDVDFFLIVICIPVICISGILLNSAYLFVLYRIRDMRTTTNFYLGNLAVADSLHLLVGFIRFVGTFFYSPVDIYGITVFNNSVTCGMPLLIIDFFHQTAMFFILFVAVERYNSVCRPLTHRRISSKSRTFKVSLFGWFLPFIFVSCHVGSFDLQKHCILLPTSSLPTHFRVCLMRNWVAMSLFICNVCQFSMTFIGNCTLYVAIVCKLSRQNRKMHFKNGAQEQTHVAKMLIINACVFFICLFPMKIFYFFYFLDTFCGLNLFHQVHSSFAWIATVASVMNSAVNPLIYGATNPTYRAAFRKAFTSPCLTARADTQAWEMQRNDVDA